MKILALWQVIYSSSLSGGASLNPRRSPLPEYHLFWRLLWKFWLWRARDKRNPDSPFDSLPSDELTVTSDSRKGSGRTYDCKMDEFHHTSIRASVNTGVTRPERIHTFTLLFLHVKHPFLDLRCFVGSDSGILGPEEVPCEICDAGLVSKSEALVL